VIAERVLLEGALVPQPGGCLALYLAPYWLEPTQDGQAVWLLNDDEPRDAQLLDLEDEDDQVVAIAEAALLVLVRGPGAPQVQLAA